jgi:hypothetical protein
MRKSFMFLLVCMIFLAAFIINFRNAFLCNYDDKPSTYTAIRDSDCGGMYLLDSVMYYLFDTSYLTLKVERNTLLITKSERMQFDKFREKLFGKKVSNIDEIKSMSCLDSAGINIRFDGGNFECPEKISLRTEHKNDKLFVFVPNIILYNIIQNREVN